MTTTGFTKVSEVNNGEVATYTVTPEELGLQRAALVDLKGGETAEQSAQQLRSVLRGDKGPLLDMVLLNAGAALMAAGKAGTIKEGIDAAGGLIDSGAAMAKLDALVAFCKG